MSQNITFISGFLAGGRNLGLLPLDGKLTQKQGFEHIQVVKHIQAHTGTYRHIQAHTGTYRHIQAHTGTYRHIQAHTGTYRRIRPFVKHGDI